MGKKWSGPLVCGHNRKHKCRGLCSSCYSLKLASEQPRIAAKRAETTKQWFAQHPDRRKYWDLKHGIAKKYGITPEDFATMFQNQEGRCAICLRHQAEMTRRLDIDHDHKTGVIRGLLCRPCNIGLGFLKDDISRLERIAKYLAGDFRLSK